MTIAAGEAQAELICIELWPPLDASQAAQQILRWCARQSCMVMQHDQAARRWICLLHHELLPGQRTVLALLAPTLGVAIQSLQARLCNLPAVDGAHCLRAGLETAITRTPLATALILANLSGDTGVTVPCLASAMVSLYITLYRPFIASQRDRSDLIIRVRRPVHAW